MQQEDEQLLSGYFDSAPGCFYTLEQGRDGAYAMPFASAGMRDLFGIEPGDVARDIAPFIDVAHPEDRGTLLREIEASARNLSCCQFEYRIVHPQKGLRWIAVHSQPQRSRDGGVRWAGFMHDITGWKGIEQHLSLQEYVLAHAHEAVYLLDRAGLRFVYVNEAACRTLGYSREELMGLSLQEIDPYLTPEEGKAIWEKVLANGSHTFETRHRRRDGSIFPVEIQGSIFEYEGRMLSLSLVRDITERKRMEDALSAREQAFRSLTESSPDVVIRVDRDLRIRYLNSNMVDYLELGSAEEVIGRQSIEIWPDGRFNEIDALRERVVATGEVELIELSVPVPGGKTAYHQVISVPERDTDGHIIGTLTFGRDITAIRETERRLSGLVENLPGIAYTLRLSPEGEMSFPYVSAGVEDVYGITPEAAMGDFSAMHGLIHPDDKPGMEVLFAESMRAMTPFRVEMRICPSGQPERWLDVRSDPQAQPDGSIFWYGFIFDITERKRMEMELQRREREFCTLMENTPDVVVRYDRECRRTYVNSAWEKANGIPARDVIGKSPQELSVRVKPIAADFERMLRGVMASGRPDSMELNWRDEAGKQVCFELRAIPEFDSHGNAVSVLTVARDVSGTKETQRQTEQFVANFPGFVYSYRMTPDGRGSFPFASPGIKKLYGLDPADVKDDMAALHALAHPDDAPGIIDALTGSARTMTPIHLEYRICRPGSPERWTEFRSSPVREADGSIVWHGIMLDIDERKRASEQLVSSQKMLADAQKIAQLGSWDWDVVRDHVEWSEMAYEIYTPDKRPAEPGFEDFKASLHPDDLGWVVAAVQSAFERDTPFDLDHRVVSASRGVRTVHAYGKVFRDADGKPVRMVGSVQDITERKRIENVLRFIADPGNVEKSDGFLTALAQFLGEELGVRYVLIDQLADEPGIAETVALYADGGIVPNMRYALKDTPCDNVIGKGVCCYPQGVQALFPQDELLVAMEAESYAAIPLWDSAGKPLGLVAVLDDAPFGDARALVSVLQLAGPRVAAELERGRNERIIRAREQEFRTLVENAPDTIARYDRDCRCIYVNPQFGGMVEGGAAGLLGKTPSECPGGANAGLYENWIREVFNAGENTEFEWQWEDRDGRSICSYIRLAAEYDAEGKVVSVLSVGRDITELHSHRKRIYLMAFYDVLTSLPNRSLFKDRMNQMLTDASWHGDLAGVMLLDLDRFKAVNDTLGHAAGDELLREAAGRLVNCVRGYDTVARLGGDEFAILLPEVRSGDDLGGVASKILKSFSAPFILENREVFISCSIGIAVYPADGEAAEELLKQADSAMYLAKRSGRNTFRFYSADLMEIANERLTLESELRRGFERGELELYFQPKVDLSEGTVMGSEALLRWNHPQRGMVPPDKFISIAEDCGLIVEIGEWVLRNGCQVACEWNAPGKPLHKVAINLSARQFQSNNLVKTVRKVLQETGCQAEWMELEITESLLLDEDGEVLETLGAFREMGFTIAIDDFGTGYSSLSYLARFPINTLKIDRSFIMRIMEEGHFAELVKAILSIAHSLDQQVVAEGVETIEQAAFLQVHGCHIAQGYLYSKPVPKGVFESLPLSLVRGSQLADV